MAIRFRESYLSTIFWDGGTSSHPHASKCRLPFKHVRASTCKGVFPRGFAKLMSASPPGFHQVAMHPVGKSKFQLALELYPTFSPKTKYVFLIELHVYLDWGLGTVQFQLRHLLVNEMYRHWNAGITFAICRWSKHFMNLTEGKHAKHRNVENVFRFMSIISLNTISHFIWTLGPSQALGLMKVPS